MTLLCHIQGRVQELRREIVEITAARCVKHHSGPEKVKHEKRIQRLWEIKSELWALIAKSSATLALEAKRQGD